jgi:hypothetical protein
MTLVISKGLTLDNGTRAAAIAGVSPTLDYRFAREKREIETVSLTDKLTYTGGNGTFVGSDGFIQRATTNIPRFDHDPLSRQSLGLLSEVERTNIMFQSENLSQSVWNKNGACTVTGGQLSPRGDLSAFLVQNAISTTDGGGNDNLRTNIDFNPGLGSLASGSYLISFYAKLNGSSTTINLRRRFISSSVDITSSFVLTNEWQRILVPVLTSTVTDNLRLIIACNSVDGFMFWGVQVEQGSTPSTYIPTTTATVTRTADSAVIDGTGVITGTYTMVEKPAGCAVVSGTNINLQPGFTAERVMVFPATLDAGQITAIRGAM